MLRLFMIGVMGVPFLHLEVLLLCLDLMTFISIKIDARFKAKPKRDGIATTGNAFQ